MDDCNLALTTAAGQDIVPAYASDLAWVYGGVGADLSLDEAATAIKAVTLGWSAQDHLDTAVAQHCLAEAHGADGSPEDLQRQVLCAAAAYMHFAAAGVDPTQLPMAKGLSDRSLRPLTPREPKKVGTTRSGKDIYDTYHHPAHKDFTTADWHDAGEAVGKQTRARLNAMHFGPKPAKKSLSHTQPARLATAAKHIEGDMEHFFIKAADGASDDVTFLSKAAKYGVKPIGTTTSGKTIHGLRENMNGPIANGIMSAGKKADKGAMAHTIHKFNASFTHSDHQDAAIAHKTQAAVVTGMAKRSKSPTASAAHLENAKRHTALAVAHYHASKATGRGTGPSRKGMTAIKSEAKAVLTDYLEKSNIIIGKTSSGKKVRHPGNSDYRTGGTHPKFRFQGFTKKDHEEAAAMHAQSPYKGSNNAMMVHQVYASGHVGKLSKSEKGEGSRGGHVIGHTKSGDPIYASKGDANPKVMGRLGAADNSKSIHKVSLKKPKDNADGFTDHEAHLANAHRVIAAHPEFSGDDHKSAFFGLAYNRGKGSGHAQKQARAHNAAAHLLGVTERDAKKSVGANDFDDLLKASGITMWAPKEHHAAPLSVN